MDKKSAISLTHRDLRLAREIQKFFATDSSREKLACDLIYHHHGQGLQFQCPQCKSIHHLTELLCKMADLLDTTLSCMRTEDLLRKFRETHERYEKWAGFTPEQKFHRSNLQAAMIREILSISQRNARRIPPGERWCILDVVNHLVTEEEWSMEHDVKRPPRESIQEWEESLERLRKMRTHLKHLH